MAKIVKKKVSKKVAKKPVAKKQTKKNVKKVVSKKETKPAVVEDSNDVEAGIDFEKRHFMTPTDRDKAVRLMYERELANKNMIIGEQQVVNIKLEIKIKEGVNLVNAEQKQAVADFNYKSADVKVKEFMDSIREKYNITTQEVKFNPASGKIIR